MFGHFSFVCFITSSNIVKKSVIDRDDLLSILAPTMLDLVNLQISRNDIAN